MTQSHMKTGLAYIGTRAVSGAIRASCFNQSQCSTLQDPPITEKGV
jgi:hypothetical protein